MPLFKCKMCGGDLEITKGATIAECEYCGTKQTVPKAMDESLQNLFNRANTLRIKSEFDKAEKLYEKIIQADTTQSEAYWGLILCKYGIEYVDDPATFKKVPTCHRASYDSIIADDDYKSALENADMSQRAIYEEQAKEIDRIQKDILALAQKEETYDVFICYKETDADGRRTQDSVIANDIYYQLKQEGFKVFYAAITLEGKLGSAYEPIIFAALNSAKVMLSIGTKPEYFNAIWVKNEWSRFLKIIKKDRSKLLIPCYRDMDAYELPDEFAHLQAQDMAKIGFINDIVRGIKKIIAKNDAPAPKNQSSPKASPTTQLILNDGDLYEGATFANVPHGYGKLSYKNGNVYEGNFNRGELQGKGTMIYANGDRYEGEWINGKRHGQGKTIWKDGGEWGGEFRDDDPWAGQGIYRYNNGNCYIGEYVDGMQDGQCKLIWQEGGEWEGEFLDGDPWDGQGIYRYENGNCYIGEYVDGTQDGQGKFIWQEGGEWEGEIRDGDPWAGQGIYRYENGNCYIGEYVNGLRNGNGKFIWKEGGEWEGEFRDDKFWIGCGTLHYDDGACYIGDVVDCNLEGLGTYHYTNGDRYIGEWVSGKREGRGKYIWAKGGEWEGNFKDGYLWTGHGTIYYDDGERYEGEYANGKLHGQGTYYFTSGDRYIGEFVNDKREGRGKYIWAKGGEWEGNFKDGYLWTGHGTIYYDDGSSYTGGLVQGMTAGELKSKNLCLYCGGSFEGFFIKKCEDCGQVKNY